MTGGRVWLFLLAGAVIPASLYPAGRGGETPWLWSLPPHPLSKIVLALALAGAGCLVGSAAAAWARRRPADRAIARGLAAAAWLAAVAACLRWHYADLGGDSDFWIRLASHPFLMSSEPFGRWSHYLAYRVLDAVDRGDRLLAVRLSSVAAGAVYLAALIRLVPGIFSRAPAAPLIAFLFVTPTALLFAGYPETTPWVYALTGVYLLAGLRYLVSAPRRPPWIESLWLMLALWSHGVACFATGAHALLIARWLRAETPSRGRIALAAGLAALPFLALAASFAWARAFGTGLAASPWYGNALGGGGGQWVALSETVSHVDVQYVFLDRLHRRDLANLVLGACPLLLVLPFAVGELWGRRRGELGFLAGALAGLLLFSVFWNADLGMRRDFDLMALFAVPAHLVAALWIDERFGAREARLATLATASAVFAFRLVPFLRFP